MQIANRWCEVCKKEKPCQWICLLCTQAGVRATFCSRLCRAKHGRNGRHRKELKLEQARLEAQKSGETAPPTAAPSRPKRRPGDSG